MQKCGARTRNAHLFEILLKVGVDTRDLKIIIFLKITVFHRPILSFQMVYMTKWCLKQFFVKKAISTLCEFVGGPTAISFAC